MNTSEEITNDSRTSLGPVLAAWFLVLIPAAWGVYYTLLNAINLFR
jgi:hypothetical protein